MSAGDQKNSEGASVDRLTIDLNVARDFLDPRRSGHQAAVELFALNGKEVELAIGPQGRLLDAPDGGLRRELDEMFRREKVVQLHQLARLSEATFPSEELFPGQVVSGFEEAWAKVIDTWKTSDGRAPAHPDDFHVEAHLLEGRDTFVTADRALREMCRRLGEEHGIEVEAMTVADYLAAREGGG
jgi:hypothetical protein